MKPFVYVSINGILSHLGYSQVYRVLDGLASCGLPSALVSLESERDLANTERLQHVSERARSAGIDWTWGAYRSGGDANSAGVNLLALLRMTAQTALRVRPTHLHARGYHAGFVALALQKLLRIPWIFDARGFWVDERLEEGRWFSRPGALRVARNIERQLYLSASRVVTLTSLHASDLQTLGWRDASRPSVVIPTCADFDDFSPQRQVDEEFVPSHVYSSLKGRPVFGIIGSLNRAYLPEETAFLAARCLQLAPNAHLLVLTSQRDEWNSILESNSIDQSRVTFKNVTHEHMPYWLSMIDWSIMLLSQETRAKRAAMPTKLAEHFASNVRVAFHGCNSEASGWVRRAEAGIVLDSTAPPALEHAAREMVSRLSTDKSDSRKATEDHFSLAAGLRRYAELIRTLRQ